MLDTKSETAQRLIDAFMQFRRLAWRHSPVAGLTPGELMVLGCIRRGATPEVAGLKVSDISGQMNVASPTITQQVTSLEAHGMVERKMDPDDRRVVRVTLTEKGLVVIQSAHESFLEDYRGLVDYLGEEECSKLAETLTKVFTYFNEVRKVDVREGDEARARFVILRPEGKVEA